MKHHEKKMLIKARRIGTIILMCLLIQQLGLHNSQGDEQKISSTTFMSVIDNRELFHGERAEASTAPASGRQQQQQQQQQRLSPPTIVKSHIPALSVISPPPLSFPMVEPTAHHEHRTMENGDKLPPRLGESIVKINNTANDEIVSKVNHRVQRDQETGQKVATAKATITTELPHLMLVTDVINPDHQIYISDPVIPDDFEASEKAKIKKGKSILEWLKDKHRLKHAIGQTVLNEIEADKLGGGHFAADGHKILASSSIAAAKVPTPEPESIGADKLSIILMEDRLLGDNTKSGSKSARILDKGMVPMITSVLAVAPTTSLPSSAVSVDKRQTINPCATDHKYHCFSKFLFGNSRPNTKKEALLNVLGSKTDLEHLISGEKTSRALASSVTVDPNMQFMHFG